MADLYGSGPLQRVHVAEALVYRQRATADFTAVAG
ncbi:MAG TPA: hypothetical protein VGH03_18665 [Caulobacteraceae bacterium]